MSMRKTNVFFGIAGSLLFSLALEGQTISAASCNATDVQNALNGVAADGTTVVIPSGNCIWTTSVTYKQLYTTIIQGQTACDGSPGVATTACTDNTIITDNITRSGFDPAALQINTAAGKSFRITGVTFSQMNGSMSSPNLTYGGLLRVGGQSQSVRIDHIHFNNIFVVGLTTDGVFGVIDHVLAYSPSEFWRPAMSSFNGIGDWGNNMFLQPTSFGTDQFMFLEDSTLTGPGDNGTTDCFRGGKIVIRHNNMAFTSVGQHGTGHAGDDRACRAVEVYQNNFSIPSGTNWEFNALFLAGGTALLWGNQFPMTAPYYNHIVTSHINREDSQTYTQSPPPGGWGYCGTLVNGTGSGWDQNSDISTGTACLDQPGRGQGDLLSGAAPNKCDQTLGCTTFNGQWPRQKLEPFYEWSDRWACAGSASCTFEADYDPGFQQNRDYFLGFGNISCEPGAVTCTTGVGVGTLSQRPAKCTANSVAYPAGNSPGVGYWATDQNTLYVCTAPNTWTAYYTPFTYPHPLTHSGVTVTSRPPAPTALQATVH
jgi:hypothetical protein